MVHLLIQGEVMKLSSLIFTTVLFVASAQGDMTIDTQIEQIMNAPASERVERMNQFKTRLATMNENERREAFQKLQANRDRGMGKGYQTPLSTMPMHQMNPNGLGQHHQLPLNNQSLPNRP